MIQQTSVDLASRRFGRIPKIKLVPGVPIVVLGIMLAAAVFAPLIAPYSPTSQDLLVSVHPPAWAHGGSTAHLLGTDVFGRDVASRLVYGARISLGVALFALLIGVTVGTAVGVTAGWLGGWIEASLMRFVDLVLSLPLILIALALSVALGPSFKNVIIVIGLLIWPRIARQMRAEVLALKQQEFVKYARAIGVPGWRNVARHILPNLLPTLLVMTTLEIGQVVLLEASLSYLGAGIPPPQASWGGMISDGQALIATGWWIALFPGIAIMITVLSFNSLGDWLRDHLDPRLKTW
jgi:peptide/nickel transport system permease protein